MAIDAAQSPNGRSEHQKVTRAGIPIVLGGEIHSVRPRTIDLEDEWTDLVRERLLGSIGEIELDIRSLASLAVLARSSTKVLIELLRAYDETLPESGWIRANATSQEVQDGFVTLLEHAFPPFGMSRRLIPADQWPAIIGMLVEMAREYLPAMARLGRLAREAEEAAAAASSPKAPSTRSPSRSGDSARRRTSGRR